MAGTIKVISSVTGVTQTTTVTAPGSGAHKGALFYVDVTGISRTTGTLACSAIWKTLDGVSVTVATVASISATGVTKLVNTAGIFDNATTATRVVPEPNNVAWTITGDATNIAGKVYAIYPD